MTAASHDTPTIFLSHKAFAHLKQRARQQGHVIDRYPMTPQEVLEMMLLGLSDEDLAELQQAVEPFVAQDQ